MLPFESATRKAMIVAKQTVKKITRLWSVSKPKPDNVAVGEVQGVAEVLQRHDGI